MKRYVCTLSSFGLSMMLVSCAVDEPLGWVVNAESCVIEDMGSSQGVSTSIDLNDVDEDASIIESYRNKQLQCIDDHVKLASYHQCDWQWGANASFSQDIDGLKEVAALNIDSELLEAYVNRKQQEKTSTEYWKRVCETEGWYCIASIDDLAALNAYMGDLNQDGECGNLSARKNVYLINDIKITSKELKKINEFGIDSLYNLKIQTVPCIDEISIKFEDVEKTVFDFVYNVEFERINIIIQGNHDVDQKLRFAKELNCSTINQSSFTAQQLNSALFEQINESQIRDSRFDVSIENETVVGLVSDHILKSEISNSIINGSLINTGESDCTQKDDHSECTSYGIGALAGRIEESSLHNVMLDNVSVIAKKQSRVGGLAGYAKNVHMTYDHSENTDSAKEVLGRNYVGGRLGYMDGGSIRATTSEYGYRHLSITGRVQGHYDVGGFVGYVSSDAVIMDIKNNVDVVNGDKERVGGFVGHLFGLAENISNRIGTINKWDEPSYWEGEYLLDCANAPYNEGRDACFRVHPEATLGQVVYNANYIGGFAGSLSDKAQMEHIQNRVDRIIGGEFVGGLVGDITQFARIRLVANKVTQYISGYMYVGGAVGNNAGRINGIHNVVNSIYASKIAGGAVSYNTNSGSIKELLNEAELVACQSLCGGCVGESDGMVDTVKSNVKSLKANAYAGGFTADASGMMEDIYSVVGKVEGIGCDPIKADDYGVQELCCEFGDVKLCRLTAIEGGQSSDEHGNYIRLWNVCGIIDTNDAQSPELSCRLGGFAGLAESSVYGPSLINIATHFGEVTGDYDLGGFVAYHDFSRGLILPRYSLYQNVAVSGIVKRRSSFSPETTSGFIGHIIGIYPDKYDTLISFKMHLISSMITIKNGLDEEISSPTFIGDISLKSNLQNENDYIEKIGKILDNAVLIGKDIPVIYSGCYGDDCTPIYSLTSLTSRLNIAIKTIKNQFSASEFKKAEANFNQLVKDNGWSTLRPVDWKIGDAELCKPYAQCLTFDSVSDHLIVPEFDPDIVSR